MVCGGPPRGCAPPPANPPPPPRQHNLDPAAEELKSRTKEIKQLASQRCPVPFWCTGHPLEFQKLASGLSGPGITGSPLEALGTWQHHSRHQLDPCAIIFKSSPP